MWKIVYNFFANFSLPFFVFFSLFKKKLRKNLFERLFSSTKSAYIKDAVWIHAASIGEAAIAESLIAYLRYQKKMECEFFITTNTYYTVELLIKKFNNKIHVHSLPLDLSYIIKHFINGSTFKALILIETEIWPNLIWTLKRYGVPVLIINGRISDKTLDIYKRFSFFLRHVFSEIDLIITQSEEHRKRYIAIGADPHKTITTGNIKYFREIPFIPNNEREDAVVFGSIKEKELDAIFYVIKGLKKHMPDIKIFIAPRELHLSSIIEDELKRDYRTVRYSKIKKEKSLDRFKNADIVVVDTVGDLLYIYQISKVAFVGGSLAPYGGQNILEPLFFETPVLFGPYMENFKEIAELIIEKKAGIMVKDQKELLISIEYLLNNRDLACEIGKKGKEIIDIHRDFMEKTAELIVNIIEKGKE